MRIAAMALIAAAAPVAAAALEPDAERGEDLARAWCADCHVVADESPGADVGPAFATLAPESARSDDQLLRWLSQPHWPMPDFNLSGVEIEDLIAYIRSLDDPA